MWLTFSLPELKFEGRLRELFERMGSALIGRTLALKETKRVTTYDINGNDACFTATWVDDDVDWEVSATSAEGNPRDGYGYMLSFSLELPDGRVLRGSDSGYSSTPSRLQLSLEKCTARDWLRLREVLRAELGPERDGCLTAWSIVAVANHLVSEGDTATAVALARECLAAIGPTEARREQLIAFLAKHDLTAGGDAMQTREAPVLLESWLALEKAGDRTLGPVFAQLCPFDPKRWTAPAPWFAHAEWPWERGTPMKSEWRTVHVPANEVRMDLAPKAGHSLTGWESFSDWRDVEGERFEPNADGWQFTVSRRARYREGAKTPVVHVTLNGIRREPADWKVEWQKLGDRPFTDRIRWSWLTSADEPGAVLLIVERERTRTGGRGLGPSGVAYTAIGSEAFRAHAGDIIKTLTKYRWHPVAIEKSLDAFVAPPRQFDGEPFEATLRAMRAVLAPERLPRAEELFACRCTQLPTKYCEHRVELLNAHREERYAHTPTARARSSVWYAAFHLTGDAPDHKQATRELAKVDHELMLVPEFVA